MQFDIEKMAKEYSPLIVNNKKDVIDAMLEIIELRREVLKIKNDRLNFIKETVTNILRDINEIINYRVKNIDNFNENDTLDDIDTKINYRYEFFLCKPYEFEEFKEMIIIISKIILSVMMEKGYMNEENKGVYVGLDKNKPSYIDVDFDLCK